MVFSLSGARSIEGNLGIMSSIFSQYWWSDGVYFSCLGCGRCCRGEPGSFLDISTEKSFQMKYMTMKWKRPSIAEKRNGECIFYNSDNNRCIIYPVRPAQCSLYPFWPSIFKSEEEWDRHSRICPGINQGKFYSAENIAAMLISSPFSDL